MSVCLWLTSASEVLRVHEICVPSASRASKLAELHSYSVYEL